MRTGAVRRRCGARPFTAQTAEHWAAMCARAEGMGKPIAAFDSIIAACALENGLTLVTRNVQDFAFTSVLIVNPWESQEAAPGHS